jgi:hypothetical protein
LIHRGSTENEQEVWPFFSSTIYVEIDEATLRHRVASRSSNDFGKSAHKLAAILQWHGCDASMRRRWTSVR